MLTPRDKQRLDEVHPELARVVYEARKTVVFMVVEGARSLERQKELFSLGKSKTMNSRHLPKPAAGLPAPVSHAVDLAPLVDLDGDGDLDVSWRLGDFKPIAAAMKAAAAKLNVPIVCGIDWITFVDAPHFELDRKRYP